MGYTEESILNLLLEKLSQAIDTRDYDMVQVLSQAYQRIKSVQSKEFAKSE